MGFSFKRGSGRPPAIRKMLQKEVVDEGGMVLSRWGSLCFSFLGLLYRSSDSLRPGRRGWGDDRPSRRIGPFCGVDGSLPTLLRFIDLCLFGAGVLQCLPKKACL